MLLALRHVIVYWSGVHFVYKAVVDTVLSITYSVITYIRISHLFNLKKLHLQSSGLLLLAMHLNLVEIRIIIQCILCIYIYIYIHILKHMYGERDNH